MLASGWYQETESRCTYCLIEPAGAAMAIFLLSVFVSMILGCVTWLVVGDRLPPREEVKLPPLNNIVIYSLLALVPVYLVIFFVFV